MNRIAALSSLLAIAFATTALAEGVVRLSEPVQAGNGYEVFGAPLAGSPESRPLAEIVAASAEHAGKEVCATAQVAQVCQKKGCFLVAHDGEAVARVTFVDYSFFVPTDSTGKEITIIGKFERKTVSEAQARHFAEDAGEDPSGITGAREEYTIVATSVVIPTT